MYRDFEDEKERKLHENCRICTGKVRPIAELDKQGYQYYKCQKCGEVYN